MQETRPLADWFKPDHGTLEARTAQWFDPELYQRPPYTLYRVDNLWIRFYYDPETRTLYPSVTSVLGASMPDGQHLTNWKIRMALEQGYFGAAADYTEERAHMGTLCHILYGRAMMEGGIDFDAVTESVEAYWSQHAVRYDLHDWVREVRGNLASFARFAYENRIKPVAIEATMKSDAMQVAGSIDLLAEMDLRVTPDGYALCTPTTPPSKRVRKVAVVDFKHSKAFNEKHALQVNIYRGIWNENRPDLEAVRALLFRPTQSTVPGSYQLTDVTDHRKVDKIPLLMELFKMDGHMAVAKRMQVFGQVRLGEPLEHRIREYDPIQEIHDIIANRKAHQED